MNKIALVIFVGWLLLSVFSLFAPVDPYAVNIDAVLQLPSWHAWFGTDDLGRSILQRMISGAAISCFVAVSVVSIGMIIGVVIGAFAGYVGGTVDRVVVYVIDVFLSFPGILLAIALAGVLGPGLDNVIIALCVVAWVGYARLVRAQVLTLRERDHVKAAQAMGLSQCRIIFRHVLPLTVAPIIVEATFAIASVVIAEAGLSFLGLGAQPPIASWGNMIRDGSRYLLVAPHMAVIPGIALISVVVSSNILGDWLRDVLDVKATRKK